MWLFCGDNHLTVEFPKVGPPGELLCKCFLFDISKALLISSHPAVRLVELWTERLIANTFISPAPIRWLSGKSELCPVM